MESSYLVCNKDSYGIRIPKQEGLVILVRLTWLCIGVLISPDS